MTDKTQINFSDVLKRAVTEKGKLLEAYTSFHNYSFFNQLLAMQQCLDRGIEITPISTFLGWQQKGRYVKKGQKALTLCMPASFKKEIENDDGDIEEKNIPYFQFKSKFFTLSQTDGKEVENEFTFKYWSKLDCLKNLEVELIKFTHINGNVQGYATQNRQIAINPLAQLPFKTMFHELGHILLGHTEESIHALDLPHSLKEVEAESVALLCLASLDLDGEEYARGYIQHYLQSEEIPEKSARKIMSATDKILKAGRNDHSLNDAKKSES